MWKLSATLLAIAFAIIIPSASAEPYKEYTDLNTFIERGPDYTRTENGVTGTWESTPPKILDYIDPQGFEHYVNYRLYQDASVVRLETNNAGSIIFDKVDCSYDYYKNGVIDSAPTVAGISWTVKGKAAASSNWSSLPAINNAACTVSVTTTEDSVKILGQRQAAGQGIFQIELYHKSGHGIKETMRGYNDNPIWNNHHIGFTEKLQVPQVIQFGNRTYDLSQYNGTILGRNWIESNKAKLISFGNNMFYDFGIGFANLNDVKITWDGSVASLSMNYLFTDQIVPYQSWFEVDPSFSTTATNTYTVRTGVPAISAACPTTASTTTAGDTQLYLEDSATAANFCAATIVRFDVSSITGLITVTNSSWIHTVSSLLNTRNCDVNEITHDPTTANPTTLWNDILNTANGTTFVNNSNWCTSTGAKNIDLGSSADTAFQNIINSGVDVISIAYKYDSMTRDALDHEVVMNPSNGHILRITYTMQPPNRPSDLACTSEGRRVDCTWTASSPLSGLTANNVTKYYLGRSLDNSTYPAVNKTSTGTNTTSASLGSYFRKNTLYHLNVTAFASGVNSTYADYTSLTTDNTPDIPSIRVAPINTTAVNVTRTAGASSGGDTVIWFALRCEDNASGGWQTITANSSLPSNSKRTVNGLWSSGQVIKCQWADGNRVGFSGWSQNGTYPNRPDAVDDLSVVAVFQTTAQISWSEPNLYGLNLYGYQVNYTSPWGTPNTVIATTTTTDTEYELSGLQPNTEYSFRVSAITPAGKNASGNIVNTQTASSFTVGQLTANATNPFRLPIHFERDDLNSTYTAVDVIYDNEFLVDCDVYQRFGQSTTRFTNLNGTASGTDEETYRMYFIDPENDVITVNCWNTRASGSNGTYQMLQSDFPILEQIANFRNGTYGTHGQFGVFDLITLFAIILGMIGLNRTNPAVGGIFMFFIVGGLAAFGIVQWYTAFAGAIALVIMLVIASTRKDD